MAIPIWENPTRPLVVTDGMLVETGQSALNNLPTGRQQSVGQLGS